MTADLQSVVVVAQVIGVVDGPTGQPQHLAFEDGEGREFFSGYVSRLLHSAIMRPRRWRCMPNPVIISLRISS